MKEKPKTRKLAYVNAGRIHPSKVLPKREFDAKLVESMKRDCIQQPIIVRPSPQKSSMFEIIDGHIRYESVQENQIVLVDIRYGLDDVAIFSISETTFRRKPRNTYERAQFYKGWVKTVEAKHGSRGAQSKVANMANISEPEVSHYLSINRLFDRLRSQNIPETNFNALKNQGVNKLYALSKVDQKEALLDIAAKMAENPNMTLEELKELIREQTSALREILRLTEEDEEENESTEIDQLTDAAEKFGVTFNNARKVLTVFTSRIVSNPNIFLYSGIPKKIEAMVKALKKIEKDANLILSSARASKKAN